MKNQKNKNIIESLVKTMAPKISELRYGEGDNEVVISVFPVLPFVKRSAMVREIVDGVFMDNKDTVDTYVPEFLTLLQKYTVLKYFTDFPLPKEINDLWLVLNFTTIYEDVVEIVGVEEIKDIFDAANNAIDTYRQYLVRKTDINSLMGKIGGMMGDIESKISKEDIDSVLSKVKEFTGGSSMQDLIGALIGKKDV